MPLTLFSLRTKRCFRSLHPTINRTKSVADCRNFWRSLACSSVRALRGLPLPVNCDCVPQLFEQLINTTLCPAFLRKFVCQRLRCVPFQKQTFLSKSCPRCLISCWLLTILQRCICGDEFPMPQTDRQSKYVKEQWHGKFYLQSVWRNIHYFNHRKYQNLWMNSNNKSRGDYKCNLFAFSLISAENLKLVS